MNLDTLNIGAININKMQTLSALVQLAEQRADVPKELWQTVRIDEASVGDVLGVYDLDWRSGPEDTGRNLEGHAAEASCGKTCRHGRGGIR